MRNTLDDVSGAEAKASDAMMSQSFGSVTTRIVGERLLHAQQTRDRQLSQWVLSRPRRAVLQLRRSDSNTGVAKVQRDNMGLLQKQDTPNCRKILFSTGPRSANARNWLAQCFSLSLAVLIRILAVGVAITANGGPGYSIDSDDLEHYEGWCIIAVKKISGYYDEGEGVEEGFKGCKYHRLIIFDDGTFVRCLEYGYQYKYRPTAILMSDGSSAIMIVGDEFYDIALK